MKKEKGREIDGRDQRKECLIRWIVTEIREREEREERGERQTKEGINLIISPTLFAAFDPIDPPFFTFSFFINYLKLLFFTASYITMEYIIFVH